jgi:hypothetical protein
VLVSTPALIKQSKRGPNCERISGVLVFGKNTAFRAASESAGQPGGSGGSANRTAAAAAAADVLHLKQSFFKR